MTIKLLILQCEPIRNIEMDSYCEGLLHAMHGGGRSLL
jgi:hypothetical protein